MSEEKTMPAQQQDTQPGLETEMTPAPEVVEPPEMVDAPAPEPEPAAPEVPAAPAIVPVLVGSVEPPARKQGRWRK